ncbi:CIPK24 [Symbiodinium natans]|uniref:CIPK24 protein n=1 Tax=Symbiodinium natans TaxID=878477 RepID=A0A812PSE6_9DINO|nr:CIPK24 [Symbiodinium natans]
MAKGQDPNSVIPALKGRRAIFIFASPSDQVQVAALRDFVQAMDAVGSDAAPMIWAPHTVTPEIRPHNAVVDPTPNDGRNLVSDLMEIGLDGIISGEPQGPALALTMRMWVHKIEMAAQTLTEVMYERKRRAQNVEYFKAHTDSLLWDYLRNRLAPVVPPCDRHLPEGIPSHIDGWSFGSSRRTPSGVVYRLNRRRQDSASGSAREVARLVDKSTIRDINGIMSLKRMVDVLWMVSCDKWQHPNIQRLLQIYHSPTHIIMRMEYSGAGSLHDRLVRRSRRPLSFPKTSQILQQIFRAVTHLHLAAKVCHRDLKPENFDLHETPDMVSVKLTGFQLAFVLEEVLLCHQKCGTLPFVAPEVLKGEGYHALPVDLWGVGISVIEILCGTRAVDEALGISEEDHPGLAYRWPDGSFLQQLLAGFQEPGSAGQLLQMRCMPQLRPFLPSLQPVVDGLLKVDPEDRWTAIELQATVELVPKGPPMAPPPLSPLPQMLLPDHEDTQSVQMLEEQEEPASLVRNESAKTAGTLGGPGFHALQDD